MTSFIVVKKKPEKHLLLSLDFRYIGKVTLNYVS